MVNLGVSDKYNGLNKVEELRNAIGTSYLSTKLISISECGNVCTVEENGVTKIQPSWITWNRFFY